ncbi:hypothetical protein RJT34_09315 [Clitoria ternatea]|uniref:beta-galactosidase n=1 Tax=Clitoria ternatea TaxID=43366 RepID=A0AAN9PV27_CLITE
MWPYLINKAKQGGVDVIQTYVFWNAHEPQHRQVDTCNGYYCDKPSKNSKPKIWTENWTGWYKKWGKQDPHRTAEDVAFAVARFFQFGGTFHNYYMYHGGTNFGRTAGGPYITTSYDYDAPLDEYGNFNQPKFGHLRILHGLIKSKEKILTQGSSNHTNYGSMVTVTVYSYAGKSICFIGNAHQSRDATITFRNNEYTIPAWSISILPNCSSEAYNTAKVNTQTSIMVKKDNDEEYTLNWQWRQEPFIQMKDNQIIGNISLTAPKLLDQKLVTNDTTDYLCVDIEEGDPIWFKNVTIRVHTKGHVLHVFVNSKHVGTQYAKNGKFKFVYESKIDLINGKNDISLLSTTVGLPDKGAFFNNVEVGVLGPVELVALNNDGDEVVQDLSKYEWKYKVGLHGEHEMHYTYPNSIISWYKHDIPTQRIFVWYKTIFRSPIGDDPVVVDLSGLGKGHAWINGHSIGRYWPSYLANEEGCSSKCDYRGAYTSNKCLSNCGNSSQKWYHVPRSFLRDDDQNTLVLFEELGGHPFNVKFYTITTGKVCANAYEGHTLELVCNKNQVISEIKFASFGLPNGRCGSFQKGYCESTDALSVIKTQCLGKDRCSIQVTERMLGPTGCRGPQNRFAVEAFCDIQVAPELKKH